MIKTKTVCNECQDCWLNYLDTCEGLSKYTKNACENQREKIITNIRQG